VFFFLIKGTKIAKAKARIMRRQKHVHKSAKEEIRQKK